MNKEIDDLKNSIWNEIKEVLKPGVDIGEFSNTLLYNEDVPRTIYNKKAVIPDLIFRKIIKSPNKDSDIYSVAIESLVIAACLKRNINDKYSIIFAKCYCALYFGRSENSSSQFEQLFFSTEFIKYFGIYYKWNSHDKKLKDFVQSMFYKIIEWSNDIKIHKSDIEDFKKKL
jgi:hypothetical protein